MTVIFRGDQWKEGEGKEIILADKLLECISRTMKDFLQEVEAKGESAVVVQLYFCAMMVLKSSAVINLGIPNEQFIKDVFGIIQNLKGDFKLHINEEKEIH